MHEVQAPASSHYRGDPVEVFTGSVYNQVGSGLFGDIFRKIVPLFTTKVLPYVGKNLLQTGREVLNDFESGVGFKSALQRGVKRTLDRGKADLAKTHQTGGRKRKAAAKKKQKKSKQRRLDYFSL